MAASVQEGAYPSPIRLDLIAPQLTIRYSNSDIHLGIHLLVITVSVVAGYT
jgi:hypothetical protein